MSKVIHEEAMQSAAETASDIVTSLFYSIFLGNGGPEAYEEATGNKSNMVQIAMFLPTDVSRKLEHLQNSLQEKGSVSDIMINVFSCLITYTFMRGIAAAAKSGEIKILSETSLKEMLDKVSVILGVNTDN